MSGRLILLRHGQTTSNVARRLDTRPPGAPLTELGIAQAAALVDALADEPVLAVLSSLARRAQATAAPLAAARGLEVHARPGLHEVDVGMFEDRSDDEAHRGFGSVFAAWHTGRLDEPMPGGESGTQVLVRFAPLLTEVRGQLARGSVVLVSHGAAIRLVASVAAGVDGRFALANALDNTAAVVLEPVGEDGWVCAAWGSHRPPFDPPAVTQVDDGT